MVKLQGIEKIVSKLTSLKRIKQFQGYWSGGVWMLCWSLIISLLQLMARGILSLRVFQTAYEKNVPMFLSSQAVSVLKQQQETTYIALPTLANSSWMTGFWPGLDWFPSQCLDQASLSMKKMLGWTVFFIALTAEVKAASDAAEEENTAPFHPSGRPTLHSEVGRQEGPSSPKWLHSPFCYTSKGKSSFV